MIKYIYKCVTGSFGRTIGRILAYVLIGLLILFLGSYLNIGTVHAALIPNYNLTFIGKKVDSTFSIPANSYVDGNISFYTSGWSNQKSGAFMYVDVCTTGYAPSLWITENTQGSMSPSTKWYKVNSPCYVEGYAATVYRQIIFISDSVNSNTIGPNDEIMASTYNFSKGRLFSNTDYNVFIRILHMGVVDEIPLQDIAYDNDLTQTQVLKDILQVLQNSNNNDITSAINSQTTKIEEQTQKIEQQIQKQEETNNFLKDDTPPDTDISSLGNVQGLLPPGPLDSLLNIPFNFLSIVVSSLSGTCVPLETTFVFDSTLTYPCFKETFYDNVPSYLMIFLDIIPSTFILIKYFKHLYKKVDRAMSLESNADDEWGVI